MTFDALWAELEPIGRSAQSGGYRRYAYNDAELHCREWFASTAQARGLEVETDRNGNLWAWWLPTGVDRSSKALVIGSHLDSVPDGGAFDGPLGVVSSFAALDLLKAKGAKPKRPIAVAAFADEEGARFGIACAGSKLMTGQLGADKARALVGRDGLTMAEAMQAAGFDARHMGVDRERMDSIGEFVELHIEQGRALIEYNAAVGVAESIWPHGRYRFTFCGVADHAGATRMGDRHDPMITYAHTALAAQAQAIALDGRATFGRLEVDPNGTNAIPSEVRAWLDARASNRDTLEQLVSQIRRNADSAADENRTTVEFTIESETEVVEFDLPLRNRVAAAAGHNGAVAPVLPTAAGHDAGILANAGIPTAMLFVRNPTGISHSPDEHAEAGDAQLGVEALTRVVEDLL